MRRIFGEIESLENIYISIALYISDIHTHIYITNDEEFDVGLDGDLLGVLFVGAVGILDGYQVLLLVYVLCGASCGQDHEFL